MEILGLILGAIGLGYAVIQSNKSSAQVAAALNTLQAEHKEILKLVKAAKCKAK